MIWRSRYGPMRLAGSPSPSAVTACFRATVSSRPVVGRSGSPDIHFYRRHPGDEVNDRRVIAVDWQEDSRVVAGTPARALPPSSHRPESWFRPRVPGFGSLQSDRGCDGLPSMACSARRGSPGAGPLGGAAQLRGALPERPRRCIVPGVVSPPTLGRGRRDGAVRDRRCRRGPGRRNTRAGDGGTITRLARAPARPSYEQFHSAVRSLTERIQGLDSRRSGTTGWAPSCGLQTRMKGTR